MTCPDTNVNECDAIATEVRQSFLMEREKQSNERLIGEVHQKLIIYVYLYFIFLLILSHSRRYAAFYFSVSCICVLNERDTFNSKSGK